jgi:hypothetical protein
MVEDCAERASEGSAAVTGFVSELVRGVRDLPSPRREAVTGMAVLGLLGALAGLVVGVIAYPPTAWFAVLELGLPSAAVGLVGGLVVGLVRGRLRS